MEFHEIDLVKLRESMSGALDFVMVHRVTNGLSIDSENTTRIREAFEDRVVQILADTDASQMPPNWSWQKAAHALSWLLAVEIVCTPGGEADVLRG